MEGYIIQNSIGYGLVYGGISFLAANYLFRDSLLNKVRGGAVGGLLLVGCYGQYLSPQPPSTEQWIWMMISSGIGLLLGRARALRHENAAEQQEAGRGERSDKS